MTVHVLVTDQAVHEEKFFTIYVLFDHVIVRLASHCTQSALVPQNFAFTKSIIHCIVALLSLLLSLASEKENLSVTTTVAAVIVLGFIFDGTMNVLAPVSPVSVHTSTCV